MNADRISQQTTLIIYRFKQHTFPPTCAGWQSLSFGEIRGLPSVAVTLCALLDSFRFFLVKTV